MDRRTILKTAGLAMTGSTLLPLTSFAKSPNSILDSEKEKQRDSFPKKRKPGNSREVSSVDPGVQHMGRTYQITIPIPTHSEMYDIIRIAFDDGVTLSDTAESCGPFESERSWVKDLHRSETKLLLKRR